MKVTLDLADLTMPAGGFDLVGVRARGADVVLRAVGVDISNGAELTLTILLTGEEWERASRAVAELRELHSAAVVPS